MATDVLPEQLSQAARDFASADHRFVIGDDRPEAADGRTFTVEDPATGLTIAEVPQGGEADVDAAVAAARAAFEGPWRTMPAIQRGRLIAKLAELVDDNAEQLAELEALDNGKPVKFARFVDVAETVAHLEYFAGWPTKIEGDVYPHGDPGMLAYSRREPVGVCAQIVPWNYPLLMAAWKIGPALAAGCTIVLKPAEQTPLTALRLGELALEAGFPPGVLNVLTGDGATGAALVAHPDVDKVAFTGSTVVGREIGAVAGRDLKRVTLELGGKSPNIVLPDADIAAAVKGSFAGMYFNSGQSCNGATRLMVHRDVYDDVVGGLVAAAEGAVTGAGLDKRTFVGPLVSGAQHARVSAYIDAGRSEAELLTGGATTGVVPDLPNGHFIEPTVFATDNDDATIVREEIFGPVLVAQPFESLEEVAARANAGEYGLAAGLWTRDVSNAHKLAGLLRAGQVFVNCWSAGDAMIPFGGFKSSGIGREHGHEGLSSYLETKAVMVKL
jgi:acyl-CoA reductase-like NAD-dependent aldehyde dehydrogenase